MSVTLEDFIAHLPDHSYIFIPTRATWNAPGVNAAIPPVPVLGKNGKPVMNKSGPNKGQPKKGAGHAMARQEPAGASSDVVARSPDDDQGPADH